MTTFNEWLNSQMYKTAIVILKDSEDIILSIPKEDQVTNEHTESINCNKCPKGYTDMTVQTREVSFTLSNGTLLDGDNLGYTDAEQKIMYQLAEQGGIKPRFRRNKEQVLEQCQDNGEYTTDF